MAEYTVLLVEDDAAAIEALSSAIALAPDLSLVDVCRTVAEGRERLWQTRPDVLLTDLGLPDGNGLELIRLARAESLARQILVLTVFAEHRLVMQCLKTGATGYLLKGDGSEEISAQIRHLRRGGRPISPMIARDLLNQLVPGSSAESSTKPQLSAQEQTVLQLCSKGCTYDEIARLLSLSPHTVETYIRRTFKKLQVGNKTEALYEARRLGLTQD